MWQAETFDIEIISRELGWAGDLGLNTARIYLHDLVWGADPAGLKERMNTLLCAATDAGIRPIFTIFDDCWNREFNLGKQPEPKPSVHNSVWVQSPGSKVVTNPSDWGRLEKYVKDIVGSFRNDERVLMWDLYNEPGNNSLGEASLGLVKAVFEWARAAGPTQPLSVGVWFDNAILNEYQLAQSDIVTFHNYNDAANLEAQIKVLKGYGRPLVCTEYMARTRGSRFETHLPIFKREGVGCVNWGFVNGRTQTIYPWGSKESSPEPKPWFHDILRRDGAPFDATETAFIKKTIGRRDRMTP
jgi:endo-1,4-beta-mannosidase